MKYELIKLKNTLSTSKETGIKKFNKFVRERAIMATKARLAEKHLKIEEFTDEELEIIIKEEEERFKDKLKTTTLGIIIASLIGIDIL